MQLNWRRWLIVLIIGILSAIYCGARVYYGLTDFRNPEATLGFDTDPISSRILKMDKECEAAHAGITKGDIVMGIDGERLSGYGLLAKLLQLRPSDQIICSIQKASNGQQIEIPITVKAKRYGLMNRILLALTGPLFPLIFIPIGLFVLALKPNDRIPIVFCLLFVSLATIVGSDSFNWSPGLREFGIAFKSFLTSLVGAFFYYFFSIFPSPSPIDKRLPWLKYVFIGTGAALGLLATFITMGLLHWVWLGELAFEFASRGRWLEKFFIGYLTSTVILGLISLVVNTRKAPTAADRMRLRIIMWSSLIGFLPLLVVLLLSLLFESPTSYSEEGILLLTGLFTAVIALLIFPVSFAYAIIKHKVIPIRLIVRRGVQYALVSRAFIVLEVLLLTMLFGFLWFGVGDYISSLDPRVLFVVLPIIGIVTFAFLNKVNRKTMPIIDRRFFRDSYNAQQILTQLGQKISSIIKQTDLFELVANQIAKALHVENVAVFLKSTDHSYQCFRFYRFDSSARLLGVDSEKADIIFQHDAVIVKKLLERRYPIFFNLEGRDYFVNALKKNRPEEFHNLRKLQHDGNEASEHLLIPLLTKDEIIGFISLSEKLSEEPFTKEDKLLLMSLASQVSIAIENGKLADEVIKQEQLRKELEIAKEVQLQLFPQRLPSVQALDYGGLCIPARGVGGDYYDFLDLGNGKLGLAIGDVSGKGIGAALLMANLQAALRSHAPIFAGNVASLIKTVNGLVCRSTGGNKYATFFYASYDQTTRKLAYVNAGHNPPLLFRSDKIVPLQTGGMVIGLFEDCDYEEGSIQTEPGDVFVAFTDGITEAFNSAEEEFGEERLTAHVRRNLTLNSLELQKSIIQNVAAFSQGREQYDDMTIIIAKVL